MARVEVELPEDEAKDPPTGKVSGWCQTFDDEEEAEAIWLGTLERLLA